MFTSAEGQLFEGYLYDMEIVQQYAVLNRLAIVDQKILWYESVNLLKICNDEESLMRFESSNVNLTLPAKHKGYSSFAVTLKIYLKAF